MDKKKWTSAQLSAIEYDGKNLLVSAAAGSGKTATLTERIIRLVTDESVCADISRMLVVTFTKAAAAELRERVSAALGDAFAKDPSNSHLSEQICRMGDAMICTMDSFFLSCVKPMFAEAGLPADFRIGDKAELEAIREDAMEEAVELFFNSDDQTARFSAVAEAIGSARTEDGVDRILLDFEEEAGRVGIGGKELYEYAEKLEKYADSDILDTPFFECVTDLISSAMKYYGEIARTTAPVMAQTEGFMKDYVPAAYSMAEYCDNCIDAIEQKDADRLHLLLENPPADKINTRNPTDESLLFKDKRGELNKFVKGIYGGYFADDPKVRRDVMLKTAEICRGAGEIICEFERIYTELKRRRGITDHSDVAKIAARLLSDDNGVPTPYGETVASRYDYVFIDEYQDTSIYQDRIFAAVASRCGRFMVGDIKQSIYRFRGGEPAVFSGYREAWENCDGCRTVFMSENFRCAEPVVQFVNAVSKYMFPYGGIPFEEDDLLIHARKEPDNTEFPPVEVCLVERPGKQRNNNGDGDDSDSSEDEVIPPSAVIETEYVARRIRHMLDAEKLPDGKPIAPSDIAVMVRDLASRKEIIREVFGRYGIPLNDMEAKPLLEMPEIILLICILKAVDNPERDVYLAGAMRSAVFGFTLGDIAEIKHGTDEGECSLWSGVLSAAKGGCADTVLSDKCRALEDKLSEYRTVAQTVSAATFIYRLIHEPAVSDAVFTEGGAGAFDRAMQFYELARGRSGGLYEFLLYLEYAEQSGLEAMEQGGGDGVSVITVHHSKGLEFPVCFLMNATKRYSSKDTEKPLILDRNFGVAMKLPDESGLVRCDNYLRRLAVLRGKLESACEEMRVLYVAMTRARERLIVTGATNSPEKLLVSAMRNSEYYCEYNVRCKKNYMDVILEALNLFGGNFASVVTVPYGDTSVEDGDGIYSSDKPSAEPADKGADVSELADMLEERLGFKYKYGHLKNIPSKLTVSKLYPEILDEFDDGAASLSADDEYEPTAPKFMTDTGYSPADSGSAAHVFLQFCNFEKLRDLGVGAELCRLVEKGFMSRSQGEAANLEYIEQFRKSEFFSRITRAKEIRREFRFNAAISAASLTGDAEKRALLEADGTDVIVQGVIDVVFTDENGRLVLADYKTDRLTKYELEHKSAAAEKLWSRHGDQLKYYALVCEKLFGKAPDEVLIYSMPLGDTV